MLKYFATIPMALLFILTTEPSEFAASLNRLGISSEDSGLYREVSESYSGIFKTIGGKILENAFTEAKKDNPEINAKDWFSTQNLEEIFKAGGLLELDIFDYEEIAEIWDNMGAYDPNELRNSLISLGIDKGITDLIVDSYKFRLIQLCKTHLRDGYITQDAFEQITEMYKLYHGLGGNGQAQDYYERVMELEIHEK